MCLVSCEPGIETGSEPLFENCPNKLLLLKPLIPPPVLPPPMEEATDELSGKSKSNVLSTVRASSKPLSRADSSGSGPG